MRTHKCRLFPAFLPPVNAVRGYMGPTGWEVIRFPICLFLVKERENLQPSLPKKTDRQPLMKNKLQRRPAGLYSHLKKKMEIILLMFSMTCRTLCNNL